MEALFEAGAGVTTKAGTSLRQVKNVRPGDVVSMRSDDEFNLVVATWCSGHHSSDVWAFTFTNRWGTLERAYADGNANLLVLDT